MVITMMSKLRKLQEEDVYGQGDNGIVIPNPILCNLPLDNCSSRTMTMIQRPHNPSSQLPLDKRSSEMTRTRRPHNPG